MSITFHRGIFSLQANDFQLIIGLLPSGHLTQYHLGAPLMMPIEALTDDLFRVNQNRGLSVYLTPDSFEVPLGHERLVYPTAYSGDYREPALDISASNGARRFNLLYSTHRIYDGRSALEGLPHLRLDDSEATTLEIDLIDQQKGLKVTLTYTVLKSKSAIAQHTQVANIGERPLTLHKVMSFCCALPDHNWQLLQLSGDWIRERQLVQRSLSPGRHNFGSTRGASSAHHNPFAALARPNATDSLGEVFGLSMLYSGSFIQSIEVDEDHQVRWMTGIHPENFTWQLLPNESFQSPEAVMGYSTEGLNALSHIFHSLVNENIVPPQWRHKARPIVLNNWEATYFDFNHEKLVNLARKGKDIGVELFVLDDGWFSTRSDDTKGLGDWTVNRQKLPHGLEGLAKEINAMGLDFGLWIEPEMVNKDTPLFMQHPEWVIGEHTHTSDSPFPKVNLAQARHQYVLDYSNPELVNHIYAQLTKVLDGVSLAYLKWDMNRNISEGFSAALPPHRMGELMHRYILGVYSLYERLSSRYPNILVESCAAGGGRFDLGMLYFAPQAWASDNSDAVSRLGIQYGTSIAYPLSAIGAHISAVPNHQTKRSTPLSFRSHVSYYGVFGLELDLISSSKEELNQLKDSITFYKSMRPLVHSGQFYRLLGPFSRGYENLHKTQDWRTDYGKPFAWAVVSPNKQSALVAYYQPLALPNQGPSYLKIQGLESDQMYTVLADPDVYAIEGSPLKKHSTCVSGAYLMQFGLLIPPAFNGIELRHTHTGDYASRLWLLEAQVD